MRILIINSQSYGGGHFKRYSQMMNACLKEDIDVHAILPKRVMQHPNLKTIEVPNIFKNKYAYFLFFFLYTPFLILFLNFKYKYNKFVVFGSLFALSCSLSKLIFGVPIIQFNRGDELLTVKNIVHRHNFFFTKQVIKAYGQIIKLSFKISDKIVANSEFMTREISRKYKIKKRLFDKVLYNNISTKKQKKDKNQLLKKLNLQNKFLVGYIGMLYYYKHVDMLIEAFSEIEKNAYLIIMGTGPEEKKLKSRRPKNVLFLGWVKDSEKILANLDLTVLPSESEGCPNVVLESLGCDVPCLGRDVPSIREVLAHDELLFGNSQDLASKLRKIASDPAYYSKIKNLCEERKKVFDFNWDKEIVNRIRTG